MQNKIAEAMQARGLGLSQSQHSSEEEMVKPMTQVEEQLIDQSELLAHNSTLIESLYKRLATIIYVINKPQPHSQDNNKEIKEHKAPLAERLKNINVAIEQNNKLLSNLIEAIQL